MSVDSLENFYKDLVASSILKDISKLPFSFYNIFNGQEVGGTGYIYDAGEIYGMSAKILCKSALLVPTQILLPDKILKMGYISNYICEPANRFLLLFQKINRIQKNTKFLILNIYMIMLNTHGSVMLYFPQLLK